MTESRKALVALLRKQSQEIASAGHNGWGNTMTEAAEALEAGGSVSGNKWEENYRFSDGKPNPEPIAPPAPTTAAGDE